MAREGERVGENHQYVVTSHASLTGDLAYNPGVCPKLGIEPATLWFAGQHSIHWATPGRLLIIFNGIVLFGQILI